LRVKAFNCQGSDWHKIRDEAQESGIGHRDGLYVQSDRLGRGPPREARKTPNVLIGRPSPQKIIAAATCRPKGKLTYGQAVIPGVDNHDRKHKGAFQFMVEAEDRANPGLPAP
jgi:hypothetical protein